MSESSCERPEGCERAALFGCELTLQQADGTAIQITADMIQSVVDRHTAERLAVISSYFAIHNPNSDDFDDGSEFSVANQALRFSLNAEADALDAVPVPQVVCDGAVAGMFCGAQVLLVPVSDETGGAGNPVDQD